MFFLVALGAPCTKNKSFEKYEKRKIKFHLDFVSWFRSEYTSFKIPNRLWMGFLVKTKNVRGGVNINSV